MKTAYKILYVIFISAITCGGLSLILKLATRNSSIPLIIIPPLGIIVLGIYLLQQKKILTGLGLLMGAILYITFLAIMFFIVTKYPGM